MTVALVPIVGPDGKPVARGETLPKSWDAAYVASLVKSGGAGTQKAWDAIAAKNYAEQVDALASGAFDGEPPKIVKDALAVLLSATPAQVEAATEKVSKAIEEAAPGGHKAVLHALTRIAKGDA